MFFEIDDIRRRHTPQFGLNNTTGWHTAVDSTPSWNYQRGIMIGLAASSLQQYLTLFINNTRLLLHHYQPPTSVKQGLTFFNAVRSLQSFTNGFKSRMQIAAAQAFMGIGLKAAVWRQFNSGWSSNFASVEWNYIRKIPTALGAFIVTSPFGVALDMIQRAYYADKTFPKQLQKGYKSFFDCMRRIPLQEGPYYLFKNTFPLYWKHIIGPFTAFYTYDFLDDKMSVIYRISDAPSAPVKMIAAGIASYLAMIFTYPIAHTTRQMVDIWPKLNGVDPFQGSYRKAFQWLWFGPTWNIAFPGLFRNYFWFNFPQYFGALLLADKLGMFTYWRIDIMSGASDNTSDDSYI